jgi:hypothetical protein
MRTKANPREKSGNAFRLSICANAADTYDSIERPTANLPHAVAYRAPALSTPEVIPLCSKCAHNTIL